MPAGLVVFVVRRVDHAVLLLQHDVLAEHFPCDAASNREEAAISGINHPGQRARTMLVPLIDFSRKAAVDSA